MQQRDILPIITCRQHSGAMVRLSLPILHANRMTFKDQHCRCRAKLVHRWWNAARRHSARHHLQATQQNCGQTMTVSIAQEDTEEHTKNSIADAVPKLVRHAARSRSQLCHLSQPARKAKLQVQPEWGWCRSTGRGEGWRWVQVRDESL